MKKNTCVVLVFSTYLYLFLNCCGKQLRTFRPGLLVAIPVFFLVSGLSIGYEHLLSIDVVCKSVYPLQCLHHSFKRGTFKPSRNGLLFPPAQTSLNVYTVPCTEAMSDLVPGGFLKQQFIACPGGYIRRIHRLDPEIICTRAVRQLLPRLELPCNRTSIGMAHSHNPCTHTDPVFEIG